MNKTPFFFLVLILFFITLFFSYVTQGIPAVFFSDISGIYSILSSGDGNVLMTYWRGWQDITSQPFFSLHTSNVAMSAIGTLLFFFIDNLWLRIKLLQLLQSVLAAVFCYVFANSIARGKIFACISGLLYATTPIFFSLLNGQQGLAWGYALLPLSLFLIEKSIGERKLYLSLAAGIFVALNTFISGLQLIFYIGLPLMVYLTVRLFYALRSNGFDKVYYKIIGVMLGGAFCFSGFLLFPVLFDYQPYTIFENELEYRKNDAVTDFYTPTLTEGLGLQSKEQMVSSEFGYDISEVPFVFLLFYFILLGLGMAALFTAFFEDSKWVLVPLVVSAGFALILSFGKHTFLYTLFNNYLPYFWTIRVPGRFLIFYALFISVASPVAIRLLLKILKKPKYIRIASVGTLIFFTVIIFYTAYFYGQRVWTLKNIEGAQTHYSDVADINNKLKELNPDHEYRVLDLTLEKDGNPHHLKAYSVGQRTIPNDYDMVWRFKDDPNFSKIIGAANIKYILTTPWPSWPDSITGPFPPLEERLEADPYFELKYVSNSGIKVWENNIALPRVYSATPIVVVGSPSSISSFFDFMPESNDIALFFADQITDPAILGELLEKSQAVFIDRDLEEKPPYLDSLNFGYTLKSNFYRNPQDYSVLDSARMELIKSKHKPTIELVPQKPTLGINLLSRDIIEKGYRDNISVEVLNKNTNIVPVSDGSQRLEPPMFGQKSEMLYKIYNPNTGKIKINLQAISLFDNNYVRILSSDDNKNYKVILELKGDNVYPEHYDGFLTQESSSELFLKIEMYTDAAYAHEVYDSRVDGLRLDFIPKSEYNYTNVSKEEIPALFQKSFSLEEEYSSPGRFEYSAKGISQLPRAVVVTESYSPQWAITGSEKINSAPVNIFSNGFIKVFDNNEKIAITYRSSIYRSLGVMLTFLVVISTVYIYRKET